MSRLLAIACSTLALCGCERAMHQMYDQPKYQPLAPSTLFADGSSSRPQAAGTEPYSTGTAAQSSSGRYGREALVRPPAADGSGATGFRIPVRITAALLARGRERFDIYCAPCHSRTGDGDGMIVRRGFPAPPSFHTDRLRNAPDSHFYEVMTRGYGVMYPYADRITPEDRWAITAYIRALQLSQHAPVAALSPADLQHLRTAPR